LGQLSQFIGGTHALVGQLLETLEVVDLLLNPMGLRGGHALAELLAFVKALQNEVGALSAVLAGLVFGIDLPAQAAAAQALDGLKLGQKGLALGGQLFDLIWHGYIVSV
jgi:hypothetical protein